MVIIKQMEGRKMESKDKKEYITIIDKQILNEDNIKMKYDELKSIFDKYKDLNIQKYNENEIEKRVSNLMKELFNAKLKCMNYQDIIDISKVNELTLEDIKKYSIFECLALLTFIQRVDYFNGGYPSIYPEYVKNGVIPTIIERIIERIN